MPRLTKITTKKGDDGTTSLGSGQRVPKDSLRVTAYGSVDELGSHIGLALAYGLSPRLAELLPGIHNELFHLGADLSFREEDKERYSLPLIEERHVDRLTKMVDELNERVGPLKNFTLPGGCIGAAQLHVARTVCRRAERDAVSLARSEAIGPHVIRYLNRLSDLLFLMARYENLENSVAEPLWDSSA